MNVTVPAGGDVLGDLTEELVNVEERCSYGRCDEESASDGVEEHFGIGFGGTEEEEVEV